MTVSLLEAARLLEWASKGAALGARRGGEEASKGGALPGWHWMDSKHDKATGFDAVVFKKGLSVVVAIKGQMDNRHVRGLRRLRAHLVDLRESIRRQWLSRPVGTYVYPDVGIDYVRSIVERFPTAEIILIGHSSGGGWASDIAARLRRKAVAFGSGAKALRSSAYANNPEATSTEIEGDPWGDHRLGKGPFRPKVHGGRPLRCPPGFERPRWRRHLIDSYIAALEAQP
jgi:pimeloyl-ACP methyl ester carboxylesterase